MKNKFASGFSQITLWIMVIVSFFPIFWLFLTSLKTRADSFGYPPKFVFSPTLDNYMKIFENNSFLSYYWNSIQIGVLATLFSLVLGVPAAYALSRFPTHKTDQTAFWILSTRMAPPIMVILPFYLVYRELHLLDTTFGLVIIYMIANMPFVVWMVKGFFDGIHEDLENAARIDGASRLKAIWTVLLPVSAPGIAASSIFCFIMSWNEFLFALVLTGNDTQTAPVAITGFITFEGVRWGEMSAGGIMIVLPVLLFGLAIQKYLVQGLTFGSVK
jgi:multiple sugar transport system permease protein